MADMVNGTMMITGPAEDIQRLMDETTTVVKEEGEYKWPTIVPDKVVPPEEREEDRPETYGLESDENGNAVETNDDGTRVVFDMISWNEAPLDLFDYLFDQYPMLKGEYFFDSYDDCDAFLVHFNEEDEKGFFDCIEVNETHEGELDSAEKIELYDRGEEARSNEEVRKAYRAEWVDGENIY
jgi:hypothetical protein